MAMFESYQRKRQTPVLQQPQVSKAKNPSALENDPLQLQRTLGNHAVGNWLSQAFAGSNGHPSITLQAKMVVRPAGDAFEQEADQMGKAVVEHLSTPQPSTSEHPVQRMEEPEEEELQMKPAIESIQRMDGLEDEEVQMKGMGDGFEAGSAIEQEIQTLKGAGSKLDTEIQQKMEDAFQTDFSSVNIHTGERADQLSQSIGAKAFTTGSDIFFGDGEYNPGSREGQELLGHELTHVIQQGGIRR
ncbi:DUF4157 domain-containing protein [Paenibacillus turpanensis]|uniref:eCIS core domain-containing protein n=1 Tax=Paenibacillus turpanensis TaxID=2689078 RepID=UPI00140A5568|nr:DUF4157 domain-containing protein [Paenibacillus turpanensis]